MHTLSKLIKTVPVHTRRSETETKPTKSSLQKLHEAQLSIYGSSTKEQKHAMIEALGGADEILSTLWKSNALRPKSARSDIHNKNRPNCSKHIREHLNLPSSRSRLSEHRPAEV